MAKTRIGAAPAPIPNWPYQVGNNTSAYSITATSNLDSSGDKIMMTGVMMWADGATHSCDTLYWRTSGSTISGTVRISLRNTDTTAGPPARDDTGVDENATHVNPAANTNFTSALSAARSIAHGELITVTWDFSAYTSGTMSIRSWSMSATNRHPLLPQAVHFDGTSTYTLQSMLPMITFEADDGTFGQFYQSFPATAATNVTAVALTSSSNPRRVALEFTVNENRWAGSLGFQVQPADATANFKLSLYEGTTELTSVTVDANTVHTSNSGRWIDVLIADQALVSGQTYRVAVEALTAATVSVYYFDVVAAGHLDAFANNMAYNTHDGSVWGTATTTRLPIAYYGLSAIEDGAAGASGPAHIIGG